MQTKEFSNGGRFGKRRIHLPLLLHYVNGANPVLSPFNWKRLADTSSRSNIQVLLSWIFPYPVHELQCTSFLELQYFRFLVFRCYVICIAHAYFIPWPLDWKRELAQVFRHVIWVYRAETGQPCWLRFVCYSNFQFEKLGLFLRDQRYRTTQR